MGASDARRGDIGDRLTTGVAKAIPRDAYRRRNRRGGVAAAALTMAMQDLHLRASVLVANVAAQAAPGDRFIGHCECPSCRVITIGRTSPGSQSGGAAAPIGL